MSDEQHPFQPGVEVVILRRSRWSNDTSFTLSKVAKVYKTGRFVLEGRGDQQFRAFAPIGYHDHWKAKSTGGGRDMTVQLVTDELCAEAAKTKLRARWRAACGAIYDMTNNAADRATDEQIASLERVISELQQK